MSAADPSARGAASAAPRPDPLSIVASAVAGGDLADVVRSAAEALECPVALALPALGSVVQWPSAAPPLPWLWEHATALAAGGAPPAPAEPALAVPVRLGREVLGAIAVAGSGSDRFEPRRWLEAAAAAAAVATLMADPAELEAGSGPAALLRMLELASPDRIDAVLRRARRLGFDLSGGGVAIAATLDAAGEPVAEQALVAEVGDERLLGLVPAAAGGRAVGELLDRLRSLGLVAVASSERRDPADLHDALREAAILLELTLDPAAMLAAQEDTFRLLVGVLLHDPEELGRLRAATIGALERYDARHDTELVTTLEAFLAHHGSTTETAESLGLHRHTVGYRLARIQEVSGLSPYESDGRERLGLGLKAHRILIAEARREQRMRAAA